MLCIPAFLSRVQLCAFLVHKQLRLFNLRFSRTTWVSQYQKDETSLDLNEARDNGVLGWQWHQLTICKQSAARFRQITTPTPHHSIFTGWMPFLPPNQQHQSTLKAHKISYIFVYHSISSSFMLNSNTKICQV